MGLDVSDDDPPDWGAGGRVTFAGVEGRDEGVAIRTSHRFDIANSKMTPDDGAGASSMGGGHRSF